MSPSAPPSNPPVSPSSDSNERVQTIVQLLIGLVVVLAIAWRYPVIARGAFSFIVTLSILVFVHELGHFQFARWAGMKVNRFAIGFPPFIYTRRKNNIDYSIGALPIGGMVDIAGLGSEEEMVSTATTGAAPDYRPNTARPYGQKQFQDAGLGWRFWVLFAGPLMNFAFAIVAFIAVYSIAGYPEAHAKASIQSVVAGGPAAKAGLKSGDQITGVGDKKTVGPDEVAKIIQGGKGKPTTLAITRGKEQLTVRITPVIKDIYNTGKPVPSIGIAWDQNAISSFTYERVAPLTAVKRGILDSSTIALGILDTIKRAASRNLSKEETKSIGGPIKIAQTVGQASEFGWPIALHFAAMLSVNLGLMNLLPLPALDGGRILFLGYELVMRRPFDPRKEGLVHAAGMVLLLAFMLFISFHDVVSIMGKGK